jgi:hypothetical protein
MISTTTDYRRPVDAEQAIFEYRFDETLKKSLSDRVVFELEESNFAPEPGVCCRLRNDKGYEFTLIYLKISQKLMVFGEKGVDRALTADQFLSELPELQAHRIL